MRPAAKRRARSAFGHLDKRFFVRLRYPRGLSPKHGHFQRVTQLLHAEVTRIIGVEHSLEVGPDDVDDVRIEVQLDPSAIRESVLRRGLLPSSPEARALIGEQMDRIGNVQVRCVDALKLLSNTVGDVRWPENEYSDDRVSVKWLGTAFVVHPDLDASVRQMLRKYSDFTVSVPGWETRLSGHYDAGMRMDKDHRASYRNLREQGAVLTRLNVRSAASRHIEREYVRITYPRSYAQEKVDRLYRKLDKMVDRMEAALDYVLVIGDTFCEAGDELRVDAVFHSRSFCMGQMLPGTLTESDASMLRNALSETMGKIERNCTRLLGDGAIVVLAWAHGETDARLEADLPAMLNKHGAFSIDLWGGPLFGTRTESFARGDDRAAVYSLFRMLGATLSGSKPPGVAKRPLPGDADVAAAKLARGGGGICTVS
jgi:hypothetical protein